MLNHIKYAAQISAKALVSWLSINIIGGVSTFLALIMGLFSILNNINVGHSGHASAAPANRYGIVQTAGLYIITADSIEPFFVLYACKPIHYQTSSS